MKPNQPYSWFAVVAVIKYMTHQDWDEVVPKSDGFTCANAVKGGWIHNTPMLCLITCTATTVYTLCSTDSVAYRAVVQSSVMHLTDCS